MLTDSIQLISTISFVLLFQSFNQLKTITIQNEMYYYSFRTGIQLNVPFRASQCSPATF